MESYTKSSHIFALQLNANVNNNIGCTRIRIFTSHWRRIVTATASTWVYEPRLYYIINESKSQSTVAVWSDRPDHWMCKHLRIECISIWKKNHRNKNPIRCARCSSKKARIENYVMRFVIGCIASRISPTEQRSLRRYVKVREWFLFSFHLFENYTNEV